MSANASPLAAAVPGLTRSDPHGPGITRTRTREGFRYYDPSGAVIANAQELLRIEGLVIPPGWKDVWISPDPLGHIQATGIDSRGRTQYRYHRMWREQRDAQKFAHMLRFADALPALRAATVRDLARRHLDRDRVAAGAVRLIDLGLFRIGGEKYAELDHHYGATTLQKRDVKVTRDGVVFDYSAGTSPTGSYLRFPGCPPRCPRPPRPKARSPRCSRPGTDRAEPQGECSSRFPSPGLQPAPRRSTWPCRSGTRTGPRARTTACSG